MTDDVKIDFSRFTGRAADTEEAARQPKPRPQSEIERNPEAFQKRQEREGRSEWSGGSMGGGTWAGRSR
jgi:hypothetical protein